MRVTFSMTYQKTSQNINRTTEDYHRLSNMVASGKRLSKPQDDPLSWSQAMDMKQGLRELSTFQKNVDFAAGWNQATTSALDQFFDLLTNAREVGLQATSGDSAEKRAAQIAEIDQISQQALGLANTQYDDLYIFGGTSYSAAPFDETTLNYVGDTADYEVRIGKGKHLTINVTGESAFIQDSADPNGTNILKRLAALKTALESGDLTAVQDQTAALESAQQHIAGKNSLVGTRLSSLEDLKSSMETLELEDTTRLSEIEDTDMLEAITQLQMKQTTLEAALKVTSMMDGLSLVRFL